MGLTYDGIKPRFAPWADSTAVKYGQLLVRLAMASRAVGEHDVRMAQMDDWLVKYEWSGHPQYDDRRVQRDSERTKSLAIRQAERDALRAVALFVEAHAPAIAADAPRLDGLIAQFGGEWPADPSHRGDPLRRIPWDKLGAVDDAPEPPF